MPKAGPSSRPPASTARHRPAVATARRPGVALLDVGDDSGDVGHGKGFRSRKMTTKDLRCSPVPAYRGAFIGRARVLSWLGDSLSRSQYARGLLNGIREASVVNRLANEALSAQVVGIVDVGVFVRCGQDDDGRQVHSVLVAGIAQDLQHLATVHFGHVQVEKDQVGHRGWLAIREVGHAKQIIDRLDAVVDHVHSAIDAGPTECTLDEGDVTWIVVGQENSFPVVGPREYFLKFIDVCCDCGSVIRPRRRQVVAALAETASSCQAVAGPELADAGQAEPGSRRSWPT